MLKKGIVAVFKYLDDFTDVINIIKDDEKYKGYEAYSPTSYHEIEHVSGFAPSPVRWFTFAGAMFGMLGGFGLALYTDFDWPIIVGGKHPGILSIPAYIVIAFEMTILFGAIATIVGVLFSSNLPKFNPQVLDKRITNDKFIIFIPNKSIDSEEANYLESKGCEEIILI